MCQGCSRGVNRFRPETEPRKAPAGLSEGIAQMRSLPLAIGCKFYCIHFIKYGRSSLIRSKMICKRCTNGGLAQSVECALCKREAPGSKPGFSILWSYSVMVITLDFESSDPGSNPGRTSFSLFDLTKADRSVWHQVRSLTDA